ncbi:MAG: hypothetical protein EOO65_04855 [Methanosarcinales archaeon]|nr:MAG: hypothetical protein EOO65_04855 [Methanosarcinales archaeon]
MCACFVHVYFLPCYAHAPPYCRIVLRGSSSHLLEEAERSLHDALCVLTETMKESRVTFGGGCSEVSSHCTAHPTTIAPRSCTSAVCVCVCACSRADPHGERH